MMLQNERGAMSMLKKTTLGLLTFAILSAGAAFFAPPSVAETVKTFWAGETVQAATYTTGTRKAKTANLTQKQAVDWAKAQNGKKIDFDGAYGAQCVDLAKAYLSKLGITGVYGNGNSYDNRDKYPSNWRIYKNTRTFVPKPGDIAVWNSGTYGHVAIVVSAKVNGTSSDNFISMDQNWPIGSGVRKVTHKFESNMYFVRPAFKK